VLLLRHLAQLAEGDFDRLMVLMPPGSAKSTYASLLFPVWWLHRHPASSVIAASHTGELAAHFGRKVRNFVVEHSVKLGYQLARDSQAAHRFGTSLRGEYFATGLDGGITGRRADLVLIDDPIKTHVEADSAAHRERVWNWYRNELVPRIMPHGRIVLIMTRWHEDDLGGRLLSCGESWRVLRLPALAEADDVLGRTPGEPLWPAWETLDALERKRTAVGARVWAALYQQSPRPDVGTLFEVRRIGILETAPAELRCVRAWDLAATAESEGRDPDWTVGLKLGRDSMGRLFVLDVIRMRGGPLQMEETIVATAQQDGQSVAVGLPQDPGQAGKHQVAWLASRLKGYRVTASPETGAKLTRATPVAAQIEAGNLTLVRGPWNDALLDELRDFPHGRKDDQVDSLARAFSMLAVVQQGARRLHVPLMMR
jgi:predicted phage terminase large subunit-like protein